MLMIIHSIIANHAIHQVQSVSRKSPCIPIVGEPEFKVDDLLKKGSSVIVSGCCLGSRWVTTNKKSTKPCDLLYLKAIIAS
jgi:hypothetical protein